MKLFYLLSISLLVFGFFANAQNSELPLQVPDKVSMPAQSEEEKNGAENPVKSSSLSFLNHGGTEQIVFDNAYIHFEEPVFRVHSVVDAGRIYIEVSESADFTQMISF